MANPKEAHLSHFNLKLNGAQAPPEMMDQIIDCSVENSIHLPDVCSLRLHDAKFAFLDAASFDPGVKMEVFASNEDMPAPVKIFCGEITGLEMDLAGHGVPTISVRGYDYGHRLQRGRNTRTFMNMTDADIVEKVCREAGFTPHVDPTSQVHDWILQNNQSDWEFVQQRAIKNGFRAYVNDEKDFYFTKVENEKIGPFSAAGSGSGNADAPDKQDADAGVIKVEWGVSLRSFRPRVVAGRQTDEVVVRGWNPETKSAIIGRANSPVGTPQIGDTTPGISVANKAYGPAKLTITDRPVHSQQEADDLARSICDQMGGEFIEADGLCNGVPTLRGGKTINIANIGKRFSGKYHVTSTRHNYTPAEGYTTQFSVSGKSPDTLLALLGTNSTHDGRAKGGDNIVVGLVTDNNDPENQSRIKVKYPWLSEDHQSYWARIASPMAGSGRGFQFIPEIDDEVLVAFEHGDVTRPFILGGLWNGSDNSPHNTGDVVQGGKVVRRAIQTRIGHSIILAEADSDKAIEIKTAGGHVIHMTDTNKMIQVTTTNGHKLTLSDMANTLTLVDMTGANSIEISSEAGTISMMALTSISLTAGEGITLNAGVDIAANAGAALSLTSGAEMGLTVGAAYTVEAGAVVSVTAGAAISVSAGAGYSLAAGAAASIVSSGAIAVTAGGALALTGTAIPMTGIATINGIPVV